MVESIVLIIEDIRAKPLWYKLIDILSNCLCKTPRELKEVVSVRGPVEGYRLVNAVKILRYKHTNSIIVIVFDTDRYGDRETAIDVIRSSLRKIRSLDDSKIEMIPVEDKLEDWIYALIKGRSCKCCGERGLSRLLGYKYKKYMAASDIPNLLKRKQVEACENASKKSLALSMGLDKLVQVLCVV